MGKCFFFMVSPGFIGFFDSGVGGLTIWDEFVSLMPNESTLYLADSGNAPYGSKTTQEIQNLSVSNTKKLIELGAKVIVVACNTATTQSIEMLRSQFNIPFIGIEPAVKPAAILSKSKVIGVLATAGTIESDHFKRTTDYYSGDVKVLTQIGEGLVSAIENGEIDSVSLQLQLNKYLNKLLEEPIDSLVLGCTHYPLLKPIIKKQIGSEVKIIDSGLPVAKQIKKVLEHHNLLSNTHEVSHKMYSTGNIEVLRSISKLLQPKIQDKVVYTSLYQSE